MRRILCRGGPSRAVRTISLRLRSVLIVRPLQMPHIALMFPVDTGCLRAGWARVSSVYEVTEIPCLANRRLRGIAARSRFAPVSGNA